MRGISDAFLNDLKTGTLCGLTDAVKNSNDLIMCFRDGYLNVYYIGHSVFKVEEQARYKRYKVSFNIGHREKKENEARKAGETEYNQKLQEAEKKIEELLVEVREIKPNYNIIRDIRAEQDKALYNNDVKAVLNKKTFSSKSDAEKVVAGA